MDEIWALRPQKHYAAMESLATVARVRIEESERPDTLALAETWLAVAESRYLRNLFADSLGLHAASRSLALFEASGVASDSVLAEAHRTIANTYDAQRAYRPALAHHKVALDLRRHAFGDDHPLVAGALYNLGGTYRRLGELDSALVVYEIALDSYLRAPPQKNKWIGGLYGEIGLVRELQGEDDFAEQAYESAIRVHEEQFGPDDPGLCFSLNRAAGFRYRKGDIAQVIDYTERAVRILSRHVPPDDMELLRARINLAQSYDALGDYARALALLDEALPKIELLLGSANEGVLGARATQAKMCAELGDTTRALVLLRDVQLAAAGDSLREESQRLAEALAIEANMRSGRGETDLALRLAREAGVVNQRGSENNVPVAITGLTLQMSILAERGDWNEVDRLDTELESVLSQFSSHTRKHYTGE